MKKRLKIFASIFSSFFTLTFIVTIITFAASYQSTLDNKVVAGVPDGNVSLLYCFLFINWS